MSKIASVLRDEIARVARKEAKAIVDPLRKQVASQRATINELKSQLSERTKQLQVVVREMTRGDAAVTQRSEKSEKKATSTGRGRFSAKDFVATRKRLKLTQEGAAKVLDVSAQTIYNWERGTVPKEKYLDRIAKMRAMSADQASAIAGTSKGGKTAKATGKKAAKSVKPAAKKSLAKKAPAKKVAAKKARKQTVKKAAAN